MKKELEQHLVFLQVKGLTQEFRNFTASGYASSASFTVEGQDSTDPSGQENFGGGDGGGDGGEGDDNPSSDGGSDGEPFDSDDDNFITVLVKGDLMRGKVGFYVNPRWKAKAIYILVSNHLQVPPSILRFLFGEDGDIDLLPLLTFNENNVVDGTTLTVLLDGLRGGGKRGHASSSTSKSKDDLVNEIDEDLGMKLLRFQAQPNASPAINEVVTKLVQNIAFAKDDSNKPTDLFNHIPMSDLEKLLQVPSMTTKVDGRVKKVADILYHTNLEKLKEVDKQLVMAIKSIGATTHLMLLHKYSDEHGNISWSGFTSDVNIAIKNRVTIQAENANAGNGLAI